jgi:hypothetical protein
LRAQGAAWPWLADAAPTAQGGLLMMVNALDRLGLAAWLDVHGAPGFVDHLFRHLLDSVQAAPHDPQRAWFGADDGHPAHDAALRLWRLQLRRFLRRHTGMDLPDVLARPAWVSASATHLDVIYALDGVDLRLRRVALDVDPGWCTWFGRIVAFHFLDAADLPVAARAG